ncbi:MAG: hypothetical protein E7Z87_01230 [Cyanobacteria bacterium SIG26]|nr:hypothetical protein [Cyanobacteria bacterium SIG26]
MACRMLFFDYRQSEESFFDRNSFANFDIKFFTESLNEKTLEKLSEEDFEKTMIISVFIHSIVDENIVSRFKNLRVISTRSTGYDHIDINSCVGKNIAMLNVGSYGNISVAQFTIGVMLTLVRNLKKAIEIQNSNFMLKDVLTGRDLNTLTLGVVGTGDIGSAVCNLARVFGMKILAYDIVLNYELQAAGVEYVELNELLQNSDVVSLHLPYTKDNYHMFSQKEFELMKNNSYFINVSRGELVDNEVLYNVAKTGKFNGLALDVVACVDESSLDNFDKSSIDCLSTSKIIQDMAKLPNVLLTPHMAYDTQEAVEFILAETFKGITDCLTGGKGYRIV